MPLRRHECTSCGHDFRILVPRGREADTPPSCPACGSQATRGRLPRVAVQFKGSGYYKTDRAKKSGGERNQHTEGKSTADSTGSSTPKDSADSKDSKSARSPEERKSEKDSYASPESSPDA